MTAEALLATLIPGETGLTWDGQHPDWTDAQCDELVSAIVNDLGEEFPDPWSMAQQAAFLLAAHFHETHPVSQKKASLNLTVTSVTEPFRLVLRRSGEGSLPPIPSQSGAGANQVSVLLGSTMVASAARLGATLLASQDKSLPPKVRACVEQEWPELSGRARFQVEAALLALWQGLQATGVLTGGAVFRYLRHPDAPVSSEGGVRLTFERSPVGAVEVLQNAPDGGAFLLNM